MYVYMQAHVCVWGWFVRLSYKAKLPGVKHLPSLAPVPFEEQELKWTVRNSPGSMLRIFPEQRRAERNSRPLLEGIRSISSNKSLLQLDKESTLAVTL